MIAPEHQGKDSSHHVLVDTCQGTWMDAKTGLLKDLPAKPIKDSLVQLERASRGFPFAIVSTADC